VRLGRILSSDGVHIGWSGAFEDITDALHEAEALRRRERWLRAYFERSPDVVLRLDSEARFLDTNPAAERIVGASSMSLRRQSSQRLGMSESAFAARRIAVQQVFGTQRDQSLEVRYSRSCSNATTGSSRSCAR
jgi:PAS domain S-box-containing protein